MLTLLQVRKEQSIFQTGTSLFYNRTQEFFESPSNGNLIWINMSWVRKKSSNINLNHLLFLTVSDINYLNLQANYEKLFILKQVSKLWQKAFLIPFAIAAILVPFLMKWTPHLTYKFLSSWWKFFSSFNRLNDH